MWQSISSQKNKRRIPSAKFDHKILIADDDQNVTQQLTKLLTKAGFECTVTNSGTDCLQKLKHGSYDLLIAEILIPDTDGYDLCRWIRNSFRFISLPIIFLTIMKDKNEILKSFGLGVNDYITKPFQSTDLITRVKSVLLRAGRNEDINQMTKLPGRNIMYGRLKKLIDEKELFCAFCADIKGLALINRAYGYEQGDKLVQMTAQAIAHAIEKTRSAIQFLAHTDADNFIFVTDAHVKDACADAVINSFNDVVKNFFKDSELESGCFQMTNRRKETLSIPLPVLSIGATTNEYMDFDDPRPLLKELDEVMIRAKREETSYCYTNQRRD